MPRSHLATKSSSSVSHLCCENSTWGFFLGFEGSAGKGPFHYAGAPAGCFSCRKHARPPVGAHRRNLSWAPKLNERNCSFPREALFSVWGPVLLPGHCVCLNYFSRWEAPWSFLSWALSSGVRRLWRVACSLPHATTRCVPRSITSLSSFQPTVLFFLPPFLSANYGVYWSLGAGRGEVVTNLIIV
jgi:hypothetical protein